MFLNKQTQKANAARRLNPDNHTKKVFQIVGPPEVIQHFEQLDPRQRGELIGKAQQAADMQIERTPQHSPPLWTLLLAGFRISVTRKR